MAKTIILAKRPDIVIKLEKYGIDLPHRSGSKFAGIAKKWAKEKKAPYDKPIYRALAKRLPIGWEEITENDMDKLLDDLQKIVEEKKKDKLGVSNIGDNMMLKNLTEVAFLVIGIVANIVIKTSLSQKKALSAYEKRLNTKFSFDMICKFLEGSALFELFFSAVADITNTSEENKTEIANILCLAAHVTIILAASNGNDERLKELYLTLKPTFLLEISKVKNFLDKIISDHANNMVLKIHLYLQQATIAFEKEDFDGFKEAITSILGLLGITEEVMFKLLASLDDISEKIHYALTAGMEDLTQKVTTISQAM